MEDCYILNPDYIIKNDINKVILYSKYSKAKVAAYSSAEWFSCIHPVQAMILSFFTCERPFDENIQLICKHIGLHREKVRAFLISCINNPEPLCVNRKGKKIRFPKHLLINRKRVLSLYQREYISFNQMRCVEVNLADPRIHTIPLQLTFMLTNRCICKCIYCYADIKRKGINELSATKIIEVIKHADIIGVQNIHLTGGEIFLFKDWDKVLSVLSDLRYIPGVISTKYPLTPVGGIKSVRI